MVTAVSNEELYIALLSVLLSCGLAVMILILLLVATLIDVLESLPKK